MMEKEQIINILRELDISSHSDSWDVSRSIRSCNFENVRVSAGASKICLIFSDVPFVVKWSTEDYEEAMQEVKAYQDAVEAHLEKFFPKTWFLTSINGVNFVAQEKIDFCVHDCDRDNEQKFYRISKTALDKIVRKISGEFCKASDHNRRHVDPLWIKMAIVLYGKKACKALCEFVIAHQINDLHAANIGYKNGRPIILDFSGYNR